jgi:hypothetical protein
MTEHEWLTSIDPAPMLEHLVGMGSERRLRLFACACCRRVWHLLSDPARNAIGLIERIADDRVRSIAHTPGRLRAHGAAKAAATTAVDHLVRNNFGAAIRDAALAAGIHAADAPGSGADWSSGRDSAIAAERKKQSEILRDVFGNPFRAPPTMDARWLHWNSGAVPRLANDIYEDRTFGRVSELAELLADAGFREAVVLDHCRSRVPHVRGCWVIDQMLGRE